MIERAYADKHFEDPEVITELALCTRKANRHSAVLVIQIIIKLVDKILQAVHELLRSDKGVLQDMHVKVIYSHCARFYVTDQVLYIAMIAPETDLFYLPVDSPEWALFKEIYTFHEFPDCEKLVKAYLGFYDYLAIANAILTKQTD